MSLLDTASLIVTPNGYKEGKLYSVIPSDGSGDLSVTRATTATRVNSAGLVELVPYNLLQYSQQFDNGYWTNFNSTITANNTTAPDGTLTADRINLTGGFGSTYVSSFSFSGNQTTISCYFKKGTNTTFYIDSNGTAGYFGAGFNLDTEIITPFGSVISSNIENLNNNGWYRCSIVVAASGSNYIAFGIQEATIGLTGYLWGAQVNEGTIKPYQKTETRLNIPRLDYSNGTCPSILVEPQRTNLQTYSSSFDNSDWAKSGLTITANQAISPSGVQDADLFDDGTDANTVHWMWQGQSLANSTTYTISFYAKYISRKHLVVNIYNGSTSQFVNYNIQNGAIFGSTGDVTATIESVGNGWYRCTYTRTMASSGSPNYRIGLADDSGNQSYTGSNKQAYIWGAQLEAGSYATSYIPTTSASVTRNADIISKTGISSLIGQTEGTIFLDFVLKNPLSATNRIISITESNWLSGGSIRLDVDYNQIKADFVNGGSNIGSIIYSTTPLQNTRYKVAIAYKENDCQMYINGVDAGSDTTTAAMPTCSELYLNALGGGFNAPYEASNINASALWKTRLTNAQLATLTTI